ncbi:hypothetical protein WDW86_13650 [Bdellovibrionota bacterium FG-2]
MKSPLPITLNLFTLGLVLMIGGCAHRPPLAPPLETTPISAPVSQASPVPAKVAPAEKVETKTPVAPYLDLSLEKEEWARLETKPSSPNVAFQNKKNAGIISLNRMCAESAHDLTTFSKRMLGKLKSVSGKTVKSLKIVGIPAIETTIQGLLASEKMKLRALVFRKNKCFYDVMLVSRPQSFAENEGPYARFVESIRIEKLQ